jgi:hypothetical protein
MFYGVELLGAGPRNLPQVPNLREVEIGKNPQEISSIQ